MSFRHLVLGFVSTAFVASTTSVQAEAPVKPAVSNKPTSIEPATALPRKPYSSRVSSLDPYSSGASPAVIYALRQAAKLEKSKNSRRAERLLLNALPKVDAPEKPEKGEKPEASDKTDKTEKSAKVEKSEKSEKPEMADNSVKPSSVDAALSLRALSKFYRDEKKPQEALTYAQKLLQIDKERFKENSLFVAEDLKLVADLQVATGNYDGAAATYQEALHITKKASSSQYCPTIKAAEANKARKRQLVFGLHDGLTQVKFHPVEDDDGTAADAADAYFSTSIKEILKSPDNIGKYDRANQLFNRYKQYLKSSEQSDKATKADDQIEQYERRIQADREYRPPVN